MHVIQGGRSHQTNDHPFKISTQLRLQIINQILEDRKRRKEKKTGPLRRGRTHSPLFFMLQPSSDEQLLWGEQDQKKLGQGKLVLSANHTLVETGTFFAFCPSDTTQKSPHPPVRATAADLWRDLPCQWCFYRWSELADVGKRSVWSRSRWWHLHPCLEGTNENQSSCLYQNQRPALALPRVCHWPHNLTHILAQPGPHLCTSASAQQCHTTGGRKQEPDWGCFYGQDLDFLKEKRGGFKLPNSLQCLHRAVRWCKWLNFPSKKAPVKTFPTIRAKKEGVTVEGEQLTKSLHGLP